MNPLRNIATIAATAVALTTSAAFANTNTPTVQTVHHWPLPASNANAKTPQHSVTIGVSSHGRGVGAKPSSPRWR